jgi:hypothetical protein
MSKAAQFIEYILASLDNVNKGASGKKLTALVVTLAYCYSHRYVQPDNLVLVLGVDAGLILGLFGINAVEKKKINEGEIKL